MFRKHWVNRDTVSEASLEFLSTFIIYSAALGLSCNTWDRAWHLGFSLVVVHGPQSLLSGSVVAVWA